MKSKDSFLIIAIGLFLAFFFLVSSNSFSTEDRWKEAFCTEYSENREPVLKSPDTPQTNSVNVPGGIRTGLVKLPLRLRAADFIKTFLFFTIFYRLFGKLILCIPKMEYFFAYLQVCLFQRARFLRELFIILKEDGKKRSSGIILHTKVCLAGSAC